MDIVSIVGCILIIGSIVYFLLYFTVKKATKDALHEFYKEKIISKFQVMMCTLNPRYVKF